MTATYGKLELPAVVTGSTLTPLDPARDVLMQVIAAGIEAELGAAWTTANPGTSIVADQLPLMPTSQIMTERKAGFPLLAVYRQGTATYEDYTLHQRVLKQQWGIDYFLGPLTVEDARRKTDVFNAIGHVIDLVIERDGNASLSLSCDAGFNEARVVSRTIGPAQFGPPESPVYYALSVVLETRELADDGSADVIPLEGVDFHMGNITAFSERGPDREYPPVPPTATMIPDALVGLWVEDSGPGGVFTLSQGQIGDIVGLFTDTALNEAGTLRLKSVTSTTATLELALKVGSGTHELVVSVGSYTKDGGAAKTTVLNPFGTGSTPGGLIGTWKDASRWVSFYDTAGVGVGLFIEGTSFGSYTLGTVTAPHSLQATETVLAGPLVAGSVSFRHNLANAVQFVRVEGVNVTTSLLRHAHGRYL